MTRRSGARGNARLEKCYAIGLGRLRASSSS